MPNELARNMRKPTLMKFLCSLFYLFTPRSFPPPIRIMQDTYSAGVSAGAAGSSSAGASASETGSASGTSSFGLGARSFLMF